MHLADNHSVGMCMDRNRRFILFLCIFYRGRMTYFIDGCQWFYIGYFVGIGGWGLIRSGQGPGDGTTGVHGSAFRRARP